MFSVKMRLRRGCVVSPSLSKIYMDQIIKDPNVRVKLRKEMFGHHNKISYCWWIALLIAGGGDGVKE